MPAFEARKRARTGAAHAPTPLSPPLEDGELGERLARGDRWAQEAFYRKYVQLVWDVALHLTGERAEAEDIASHTFAEALRDPSQWRDGRAFRRRLAHIVVQEVDRRLRHRRLLRRLGLPAAEDVSALETLAATSLSPDVTAELHRLGALSKALRPRCRIAWTLRFVEGCSLDEVAQYVGCSLATAKREIRRADAVLYHRFDNRALSLRPPLKAALDDELSELRVQSIWRNAYARPARRPWLRHVTWAAMASVAAALAVGLHLRARPDAGSKAARWPALATVDERQPARSSQVDDRSGALTIRGNGALRPHRRLGGERATSLPLSDGSFLQLRAASRIEVLENSAAAFALRLTAGGATLDAMQNGPRRFWIECDDVRVEALGGGFSIERTAEAVVVQVTAGAALVHSPSFTRRLNTGEHVYIKRGTPAP